MNSRISRIRQQYFSGDLDFRLQIFNLLAAGGISVSLIIAGASIWYGNSGPMVFMNLAAAVVAFFLIRYINHSRNYQRGYTITIIIVFLILFPVIFFNGGGIRSGMPCFFVFAIVFTILMLDSRRALIMSLIEAAAYTACCVLAFVRPELVTPLGTDRDILFDVIICFLSVSLVLGVTIHLLLQIYRRQQRQLDEQNIVLQHMNQSKTELLANMSHEMKTPLTVVSVEVQQALDMMGEIRSAAKRRDCADPQSGPGGSHAAGQLDHRPFAAGIDA